MFDCYTRCCYAHFEQSYGGQTGALLLERSLEKKLLGHKMCKLSAFKISPNSFVKRLHTFFFKDKIESLSHKHLRSPHFLHVAEVQGIVLEGKEGNWLFRGQGWR